MAFTRHKTSQTSRGGRTHSGEKRSWKHRIVLKARRMRKAYSSGRPNTGRRRRR